MAEYSPDVTGRRPALAALGGLVGGALLATRASAQETRPGTRILVVSRERILRETRAAKALRDIEARETEAFQTRVDAVKQQLEDEETELARLRPNLGRDRFAGRTEAFDRQVRYARRETRRQAASLQESFRTARDRISASLVPVLIDLLRSEGAEIVLDAEHILLAAPSVDRTDQVIRMIDERVPMPEISIETGRPLLPEDAALPDTSMDDGAE